METTVFIGNGLNRTLEIDGEKFPEWKDLLNAKSADTNNIDWNISYPIIFELTLNNLYLNNRPEEICSVKYYDCAKDKIKETIEGYQLKYKNGLIKNTIHKEYMDELTGKVKSFITTNYDYILEYAFCDSNNIKIDELKFDKGDRSETKYSLYRHITIPDKSDREGCEFYHIHGELEKPSTIMLGYEHYAGALHNIRQRKIKLEYDNKKHCVTNINNFKDPLLFFKKDYSGDKNESKNYWYKKFFTDNIHIVGFGLDYSELDVWWILTYRAYIKNLRPDLIKNNITFHEIITKDEFIHPLGFSKEIMDDLYIDYNETKSLCKCKGDCDCDCYLEGFKEILGKITI